MDREKIADEIRNMACWRLTRYPIFDLADYVLNHRKEARAEGHREGVEDGVKNTIKAVREWWKSHEFKYGGKHLMVKSEYMDNLLETLSPDKMVEVKPMGVPIEMIEGFAKVEAKRHEDVEWKDCKLLFRDARSGICIIRLDKSDLKKGE